MKPHNNMYNNNVNVRHGALDTWGYLYNVSCEYKWGAHTELVGELLAPLCGDDPLIFQVTFITD